MKGFFNYALDSKGVATVQTDQKMYVGTNPEYHVKRCLTEISETIDNPILAYSGGMDSGFVLRCLADLKLDKIKVYHGIFTSNGKILAPDSERALDYARYLGFDPKIVELKLDRHAINKAYDIVDNYGIMRNEITLLQEVWIRSIDGVVIKSVNTFGGGFGGHGSPEQTDRYLMQQAKFIHYLSDSNAIDLFDWDVDVFCSMISKFFVESSNINFSPFPKGEKYHNPMNPYTFNESLFKWLIYLNCYPDMKEIFFKFPTAVRDRSNKILYDFLNDIRDKIVNLPNDQEYSFINVRDVELNENTASEVLNYVPQRLV
ncbi:MAG: hypothetical protein CL489_05725 [Acidobacteria bacterium]|nr:hypothetical protein [Acidobacteriota bacterium]